MKTLLIFYSDTQNIPTTSQNVLLSLVKSNCEGMFLSRCFRRMYYVCLFLFLLFLFFVFKTMTESEGTTSGLRQPACKSRPFPNTCSQHANIFEYSLEMEHRSARARKNPMASRTWAKLGREPKYPPTAGQVGTVRRIYARKF